MLCILLLLYSAVLVGSLLYGLKASDFMKWDAALQWSLWETKREWLHQLLQGETPRRCLRSPGTLQGGGSQQVNSVSYSTCWGGIYSEPSSVPCLPPSFQCQNWNVLHDTAMGTVSWVCALDQALFLLNVFAEQIVQPTPIHVCHCLSSSAQMLPLPVSIRNFPLTTTNDTSWGKTFQRKEWQFKSPLNVSFGDLCHFSITYFSEPACESTYLVFTPWYKRTLSGCSGESTGDILADFSRRQQLLQQGGRSPSELLAVFQWWWGGALQLHTEFSLLPEASPAVWAVLVCCWPLVPALSLAERRYSRSRPKALTPLTEQEGEAYLEKCGSIRRHTVANAHSDIQLLAMASMMHTGMVVEESDTPDKCLLLQPTCFSHRQCSSEPSIADGPEGGVAAASRQDPAELNCTSVS